MRRWIPVMDWHQVGMDLCVVGIFSVAGILLLCVGFFVVKLIFPFSFMSR